MRYEVQVVCTVALWIHPLFPLYLHLIHSRSSFDLFVYTIPSLEPLLSVCVSAAAAGEQNAETETTSQARERPPGLPTSRRRRRRRRPRPRAQETHARFCSYRRTHELASTICLRSGSQRPPIDGPSDARNRATRVLPHPSWCTVRGATREGNARLAAATPPTTHSAGADAADALSIAR